MAAQQRTGIELDQAGKVFVLATSLTALRSQDAREREVAARATGALLAPFLDAEGTPVAAPNGAQIRGSCGATFISPSYALTAAHCVDRTIDTEALVVEMYRPGPELDAAYLSATSLEGSFPDFEHARLGREQGYHVDRYPCAVVARCSETYGPRLRCDGGSDADSALLLCSDAPGLKYGFLDVVATEDLSEEPFLPWKHEVYAIPPDIDDDRWQHYVVVVPGEYAQNYHYFGANLAGEDHNQLLPLIAPPFADGTLHRKLSASDQNVSTDLFGCHGTSGSGVLQKGVGGAWELLGPVIAGNPEHDVYLCDHIPSLDGMQRVPGSLGVSYLPVPLTKEIVTLHLPAIVADSSPWSYGVSLYTHLGVSRDFLTGTPVESNQPSPALSPPTARASWDRFEGWVFPIEAGQSITVPGFAVEADQPYRIGVSVWSSSPGCVPPCAGLELLAGDELVLSHDFAVASATPVPVAAPLVPLTSGSLPLSLRAVGERIEVGELTVRPEGTINRFDHAFEQLEAVLMDQDATPPSPWPMRFVGDGVEGFAAWLLPRERLVLIRQALFQDQRWSARFSVRPSVSGGAVLTCGLLDGSGEEFAQEDCSRGFAELDDRGSEHAPGAFFIENEAETGEIAIDDVMLVSSSLPDQDGDGRVDLVDDCPEGPVPPGGELEVELAPTSTRTVCLPSPSVVTVPVPEIRSACEEPHLVGWVSRVRDQVLEKESAPTVSSKDGAVTLPLGNHEITWQVEDAGGGVYAKLTHTLEVVHRVGPECCDPGLDLLLGTDGADWVTPESPVCVLAQGSDDWVLGTHAADWIFGDEANDYLRGGGADEGPVGAGDLLLGGAGGDYLACGSGGTCTVYGGPGADTIHAVLAARAEIHGGAGADIIIGSSGDDLIFPGPGTLAVLAGEGDDTVSLLDSCEITAAARLEGGDGRDRLVLPVESQVLEEQGVRLRGFEDVTVDALQGTLADCFGGGS